MDGAEIDKIASSSSKAKSKTRLSTGSTKVAVQTRGIFLSSTLKQNVPQENKSANDDPPRKKVSKKLSIVNTEVKSSAVIDVGLLEIFRHSHNLCSVYLAERLRDVRCH